MTQSTISQRGFAVMDLERQRQLASKGGKAAHQNGSAHQFTSKEARDAGRKGGMSVSINREYMAMIGRKGGQKSGANRQRKNTNGTPAFAPSPMIAVTKVA